MLSRSIAARYCLGRRARLGVRTFSSTEDGSAFRVDASAGNGVVVFEMNRPRRRNALGKQLIDEFQQAISDHNSSARCVILQSSTPGMFCAGADLKERS